MSLLVEAKPDEFSCGIVLQWLTLAVHVQLLQGVPSNAAVVNPWPADMCGPSGGGGGGGGGGGSPKSTDATNQKQLAAYARA